MLKHISLGAPACRSDNRATKKHATKKKKEEEKGKKKKGEGSILAGTLLLKVAVTSS